MIFRERSICVICDVAPATTRDHVPPRAFFKGMGARLRLIAVPACQACNNGASKLDEQLRLYVSLEVGKPTSDAAALWDKGALRSLDVSQGLRKMLAGNYGYAVDPVNGKWRDAVELPVSLVEAVNRSKLPKT